MIGAGIHEIPVDQYHADPAPEPSLSHSGICRLLELTPAHFAAQHPKLTKWPDKLDDKPTDSQRLGTVVHSLILGRGAAYQPLRLSDFLNKDGSRAKTWNNADAKRAWEEAEKSGHVPIDQPEYERALEIADWAEKQLREKFGAWPAGRSEQTVLWQRETPYGEIWGRALDDHLIIDDSGALIIDLKSTALPLSDFELSKKVADGDDIQAAWYIEGIEAVHPELAGRVKFAFAFAEVEPPYLVRLEPMPEGWLTMARRQCDRAAAMFAKCLKEGRWPGWKSGGALQCPTWREKRWMDAELAEEA